MTLLSRYDLSALRPPAALASEADWRAPSTEALEAWGLLKGWCFDGTGIAGLDGYTRALRLPLSVASLHGGGIGMGAELAEALCQDLDGSVSLATCPGVSARLVLRLRAKFHDSLPWRRPQSDDPWDCGYVREGAQGLAALARFTPRRATLIVAPSPASTEFLDSIGKLALRQGQFRRPVRLLLLQGTALPEGLSATSIELNPGAPG